LPTKASPGLSLTPVLFKIMQLSLLFYVYLR
jgi:hypothetical protein